MAILNAVWNALCDLFDGFCNIAGAALFETWYNDRH